MPSLSQPSSSESAPLLPTTLPQPHRRNNSPIFPSTPTSTTPRTLTSLLMLPLLVTIPALLFFTLNPQPPATLHPGISQAGPIHLPVPHVPLSFVALGDWGREGKHGQTAVAQAMANTVQSTLLQHGYNPHFIISTGDNFYSRGVDSVDDEHFNNSYRNVYNHVTLSNVPWYSVLGNHDHAGNIDAQVQFTSVDARWNMPATYFAQQFADNLVAIFLDTTPFVTGTDGGNARDKNMQDPHTQLRWLKRQLENSPPSAYFLIIGHHNMYTMSTNGHLGSKELREMLEPVLLPYRERTLAYISGHEHSLMHMQPHARGELVEEVDRSAPYTHVIDHFVSGAGSKLDAIVTPEEKEVEKWEKCCGVLPVTEDEGVGRTVWGKEVHGFFVFRFDGVVFSARAIDEDGNEVYNYEKRVKA